MVESTVRVPLRTVAWFAFAVVIGAALFGVPRSAHAEETASVLLERLTWTEIRDAVHGGMTTVIIPVGGTEQSGPFIAVGKHNRRVAILSERIAHALGNAMVAPVIAYVPEGSAAARTSHMRFPGTITVPDDVFEKTLASAAESFRVHGFTDVVLIGDHGGYQSNLNAVADRLNRRWAAGGARAIYVPEYYRALEVFANELKARGFESDVGTHADLSDTSLMLATDPSMVRVTRLRIASKPGASVGVYGGDPRKATAELGRLGVDMQVSRTVDAIRRATMHRRSRRT